MKASMRIWKLALAITASVVLATPVKAVIAFNYPAGLGATQELPAGRDRALATVFAVGPGGIMVNALGAYDNPGNGVGTFGGTVSVAIYQVTLSGTDITGGSLVVSPVDFSTGNPGTIIPGTQTALQSISPVYLDLGTYMIVANHYGTAAGTEAYYDRSYSPGNALQPSADTGGGWITYGHEYIDSSPGSWGNSLPGQWALVSDAWVPRWTGGNFDFTPVPEASQFAMAGVGLLGLVYFGRFAWQRRKGVA
jgi:hypothetical protein